MMANVRGTARKDFIENMTKRGVPGLEALGFTKVTFIGVFHGKDAQGAYFPMLRLQGNWLEFLDISFSTAHPLGMIVQPWAFVWKDTPPTVDALQGADIAPVMTHPGVFKTRFIPQRSRGWLLGPGGAYVVKAGLTDKRAAAVTKQMDRLLDDVAVLDQTRKRYHAKTGVYEIALIEGKLQPLRLIEKGSNELRTLLS